MENEFYKSYMKSLNKIEGDLGILIKKPLYKHSKFVIGACNELIPYIQELLEEALNSELLEQSEKEHFQDAVISLLAKVTKLKELSRETSKLSFETRCNPFYAVLSWK